MGAYQQVWKSITGMPANSLKDKRYHAVVMNAEGKIDVPEAAGANAIGIAYEPNDVGEPTQVVASGIAFVVFGDTVEAGDAVMVDAGGKVVKYAAATEGTNFKLGTCLVGGAEDEIGSVLLG